MPIRLFKNEDGTYQYVDNYTGEWKPFGPTMNEMPTKEDFNRVKSMGEQYTHRTPESKPISLAPEEHAKVHGREVPGVFDTIMRNLENTWYGVKQITGNTTPEEDAEWAKEEAIRSATTPWSTATAAFGTELVAGGGLPTLPRTGLRVLSNQLAKRQLKDELAPQTPFQESIKSLSDRFEYGGGTMLPIGYGGATTGGALGVTAPLTPEQMENEWTNRAVSGGAGIAGGRIADFAGTSVGFLRDARKARQFDEALKGDLPHSMRFPRHQALQDPVSAQRWEKAKRGGLGERAQQDVVSAERRTNVRLQNNIDAMRKSLANDPEGRAQMKLEGLDGPTIKPSNVIASGWDTPLKDMRKEAARLKKRGGILYDQSRMLGPLYGGTDELERAIQSAKYRLYEGPQARYASTDLAAPVRGVIKELDKIANSDTGTYDIHDLMGLHRKLNASWRKPNATDADLINKQISDLKREIDTMIDRSNISGSPEALAKWRAAREVYTDWNQKYMEDPITRLAIDPDTNPERLANKLFPRSWESTTSLDDRVSGVNNLLAVHPNWKPYLKQDLFNAMVAGPGSNTFDSKRFVNNYNHLVGEGRFKPVLDSLYSPDEMSRLSDLHRVTAIRNTNPSDPDFTPGYAPGPIASTLGPVLVDRPGMWGRQAGRDAIRRERLGAMPTGRSYGLPAGVASEEVATAYGIPWGESDIAQEREAEHKEAIRELVRFLSGSE